MNRTAILAAIGAVAIAGATAVAATRPDDRPVPLVAAGASTQDDETTTTTEPEIELDEPTTTTSIEEVTTTTTTEAPTTTTTTEAPPPSTTTTIASEPRMNIRCWGDGQKTGTKPGDGHTSAWVYCEFNGVHPRATSLSLTRDGETIARTDDTGVTSYKDHEVRPGATYSYQVHSHTEDGSVLQSSYAVRATAGSSAAYDGPLVLQCAGSGDGKSGAKPGTGTYVKCEWNGVPEGARYVKLVRDGTPINRSDDAAGGSYVDHEVWPGDAYSYQVHAYAADDSLVGSSEVITVTPGEGA